MTATTNLEATADRLIALKAEIKALQKEYGLLESHLLSSMDLGPDNTVYGELGKVTKAQGTTTNVDLEAIARVAGKRSRLWYATTKRVLDRDAFNTLRKKGRIPAKVLDAAVTETKSAAYLVVTPAEQP